MLYGNIPGFLSAEQLRNLCTVFEHGPGQSQALNYTFVRRKYSVNIFKYFNFNIKVIITPFSRN